MTKGELIKALIEDTSTDGKSEVELLVRGDGAYHSGLIDRVSFEFRRVVLESY